MFLIRNIHIIACSVANQLARAGCGLNANKIRICYYEFKDPLLTDGFNSTRESEIALREVRAKQTCRDDANYTHFTITIRMFLIEMFN